MWKLLVFLGVFSLLTACKSSPPQSEESRPSPASPAAPEAGPVEVKEPEFIITSIKILQADLINTRLKLSLKIDNPNVFPITLALFRYELYGDGNFWTRGVEKNLAVVPAQSALDTGFEFEMNFIGMKRRLLDDIIAMREVRYRIAGDMDLEAALPGASGFRVKFDYSGNSVVEK